LLIVVAGAEAAGVQESVDYIFENMSARMADQLREEAGDRDTPKAAEIEEAMGLVVDAIRTMEKNGDLMLLSDDGDDE
jgi:flagellar motor switch protein FliG